MASGGARAFSGPAPQRDALRRNRPSDRADWLHLPAVGRSGRAPSWPLDGQTARERVLWAREWRRPQAVIWERTGQETQVAMYVRCLVEAEVPGGSVMLRNLVKQLEEGLGVSLTGMARHRWTIDEPPGAAVLRPSRRRTADRLEVLDGGA